MSMADRQVTVGLFDTRRLGSNLAIWYVRDPDPTDGRRTDGRRTDGRRTDDGRKNRTKKIQTKKFRRKQIGRKKKIGGKARGQGTAAAEARHG